MNQLNQLVTSKTVFLLLNFHSNLISVLLNENFVFTRPLTVTGAFILPDDTIFFHEMVLDRIDDSITGEVGRTGNGDHRGYREGGLLLLRSGTLIPRHFECRALDGEVAVIGESADEDATPES